MIDEKKLIMAIANWQQTLKPGWSSANDTDTVICNTLEEVVGLIESQPPADVPDTNVGEWIPCSERLPEKAGNYIVTSKGCTWVAYWFYHTWWGIEKRCRWTDVEAWMPLPEPYKGVE